MPSLQENACRCGIAATSMVSCKMTTRSNPSSAILVLQPSPGSRDCGAGANGSDDQERVRHANRIGQYPGQWSADQATAEYPNTVHGHHSSAHIIASPEL